MVSPAGLIAHPFTTPVCPRKVRRSSPVRASHTLSVQSAEADTIVSPAGLIAHPFTSPVCSRKVRRDDIMYVQAADGRMVPLLPLVLVSMAEETPGVKRFQIVQVDPITLRVRLETEAGADRAHTWEELHRRLYGYVAVQGVPSVKIELAQEGPQSDPVSGKFRQLWVQSQVVER